MPATTFARYAVYWAPESDDPLGSFGARWLGHEPSGGATFEREHLGLSAEVTDRITAEPRRYGLHATLKAPFRLREGVTLAELADQTAALAADTRAFATAPLQLRSIMGFLALCPAAPSRELDGLAHRCVRDLDDLRAPLNTVELSRRKPELLSPRQRALLDQWGYPYVLDEFRFHISLTGRLSDAERQLIEPILVAATRAFCTAPFEVRSIALFGDPGGGVPFRLLQRFPLAPA